MVWAVASFRREGRVVEGRGAKVVGERKGDVRFGCGRLLVDPWNGHPSPRARGVAVLRFCGLRVVHKGSK
jgi:hypothetical protein